MFERRVARSHLTDKALHAWLGAVARRNDTVAIIVADDDGLLIGGGIEGEPAEEMAAVAAAIEKRPVGELFGHPLTVLRHVWQGETLYIAALGERRAARAGIEEAIAGVDRILAEGGRAPN